MGYAFHTDTLFRHLDLIPIPPAKKTDDHLFQPSVDGLYPSLPPVLRTPYNGILAGRYNITVVLLQPATPTLMPLFFYLATLPGLLHGVSRGLGQRAFRLTTNPPEPALVPTEPRIDQKQLSQSFP
ncbi:hypothetical protein MPNT_90003 [Candidatus Methylacidithermus pantelleriae]|uniref:Uncharacterized protein n=1 Tax=Candidatus Methylacidithermus pantelleriae TaxID=2744239 RepID=A0A8J2BRP9_9BACT|nr:hypothetical protein MPNT_90003 [Candidatus Methylacidithermus pantelleriae]